MGEEDNDQTQDQGPKINPNWQPLLDKIPDSLHSLILPDLQEWDKGVQGKIQELHSQYDPYKDFVTNKYDPEALQAAAQLQQAINDDPETFLKQAAEYFDIKMFDQPPANTDQELVDLENPGLTWEDIQKDPRFKPLVDQQEALLEWKNQQEEDAEDNEAIAEWEQELKDLHEEFGEFDDNYVNALVVNDIDPKDAVKQFQALVSQAAAALSGNGQQQANTQQATDTGQKQAPVVMGGAGNTGSGLPDKAVKMGDLQKPDLKHLVEQMLAAGQEANNTTG